MHLSEVSYIIYKNWLAHYGVKGQKWGIKNGPPYPLNDDLRKQIVKRDLGLLGSLSINDKTVRMLALVGAGAIGAIAISQMDSKTYKQLSEYVLEDYLEKYNSNREFFSLNNVPKIHGNHDLNTIDEQLSIINHHNNDSGGKYNCIFCVSALVMRIKGYDVSAIGSSEPLSPTLIGSFFKDAEVKDLKASGAKDLLFKLFSEGEGSYGSLGFYYKDNKLPGHNVFWMIINGKVRILDPQNNSEYTMKDLKKIDFSQSIYSNLTNCEPTEYILGALRSS